MQKALHPLRFIGITQKMYVGTHIGKPAIDFGWRDEASKKCYAPFDCIVKKIYTEDANEVWIESKEPVLWADGTIDYMTLLLIHDNDISNLYVGQELKQGEYFYDMGNKGLSSGVHLHLEVGRGKFTGSGWYKDSETGKWRINNGVEPPTALMVTNDTLLGDSAVYNWKRESEVTETSEEGDSKEMETLKEQIELLAKEIQELKYKNNLLEKENETLKEDAKIDFEYIAQEDGYYKIYLHKNEKLQIKKA